MSADLVRHIRVIEQSALFSADWYSICYPEVAASGMSPAEHYFRIGGARGHDPGPEFSTRAYLDLYPDVAAARMNALFHYETFGRREGRVVARMPRIIPIKSPARDPAEDPVLLASMIDARRPTVPTAEARALVASVLGRQLTGQPLRLLQSFDAAATRAFVDALVSLPPEQRAVQAMKC